MPFISGKMMQNDPIIDSLLAKNPFRDRKPPRYVRALHYRYKFTRAGSGRDWWQRRLIGEYIPVVSLKDLRVVYKQFGWEM
jgi:hypothetical protein